MGCRQVVRHWVLISACTGSNPVTPAIHFLYLTGTTLKNTRIFTGNSNPNLAQQVAQQLGLKMGSSEVGCFSDGETMVRILENVRGRDIVLIQSLCAPSNDNLMELLSLSDALRRASAATITAIVPYFGYARQDRRVRSARVPITAKIVADMFASVGIDRVITVDLHAEQIQGFFHMPVDNIYASPVTIKDMLEHGYKDAKVVSPDVGGVQRARAIAKRLNGAELAIIDKRRPEPNQAKVMNVIGDVSGQHALIVDDIVDTAGTLCQAADALFEKGATGVSAYCTHAVLSGPAIDRIEKSRLQELVVSDSIPLSPAAQNCAKIRQISLSGLLVETVQRINDKGSVSSMFSED
jgi:ribose-phosphate pyrophosphokinase